MRGRGDARGPRRVVRQLKAEKRRAQGGKKGQKMAKDMKKGGEFPPFGCFLVRCCCPSGYGSNGQAISLNDVCPDRV